MRRRGSEHCPPRHTEQRLRTAVHTGLLATAAFSLSLSASAAPCGQANVDVTFPPDGAHDVPTNAVLSAHYTAPADYRDEPVTLTDPNGAELDADISYDAAETTLRAVPVVPLIAGTHRIAWPALRGVSSGVGLGATTTFTVGDSADTSPPVFDGLEHATWDLSREHDPCTDALADRFTYDLTLGQVTDDHNASLLAVVVFETQSPTHPAGSAPEELTVAPLAADGHVHVARASTSEGQVCFAAIVRDLALNVSGGGEREACVHTTAPPFFDGCSISAAPNSKNEGFGYLLTALGVVCCQRVRRVRRAHRTRARKRHGAFTPFVAFTPFGAFTPFVTFTPFIAFALSGCNTPRDQEPPRPTALEASPFVCSDDDYGTYCKQRYPRLPDDGEWRCAELDGVALCAGGEPAAGVVPASASRGYRCGARRGGAHERVCVDPAPDYPSDLETPYRCRFDAEHGLARECRPVDAASVEASPDALPPLPAGPPHCWLDADCAPSPAPASAPSSAPRIAAGNTRCDRGYCASAAL